MLYIQPLVDKIGEAWLCGIVGIAPLSRRPMNAESGRLPDSIFCLIFFSTLRPFKLKTLWLGSKFHSSGRQRQNVSGVSWAHRPPMSGDGKVVSKSL